MALPLSRNTTYSAGVVIKSADLNDLQDMIIGAKHGSIVRQLPIAKFQPRIPATTTQVMQVQAGVGAYWESTAGSSEQLVCPVDEPTGTKITSISVGVLGSAGATVDLYLWRYKPADGTITSIANTSSTLAATNQTLTLSGLTEILTSTYSYLISVYHRTGHRVFGGYMTIEST